MKFTMLRRSDLSRTAFTLVLALLLSGCGQTTVTPAIPPVEPEPPTCVLGPERPAPTVSTLAVCGDEDVRGAGGT